MNVKKETVTQIILTADDGMTLTDGKTFGTPVVLPKTADENKWREITEAEYNAITEVDSLPVDEEVEIPPMDEEINASSDIDDSEIQDIANSVIS